MPELISEISSMGSLVVVVIVQLIGLGMIFGKVSSKLTHHDEQIIRQEARLDEHGAIIREHDRDIAAIKGQQAAKVLQV